MRHYRLLFSFFLVFATVMLGLAQPDFYAHLKVSRADTLRGKLRAERTCYDVGHYDLDVALDIPSKSIQGKVTMTYQILRDFKVLQVDLFENMRLDSVLHDGQRLSFERVDNAIFIQFPETQNQRDRVGAIEMFYHGQPKVALNPPWDGGFSWAKDPEKSDWVVVSCEGIGASLWWPNKDHLSDEPDSMDIHITVPDTLQAIANGRLVEKSILPQGRMKFHWAVAYPINNYNVTLYVGKYAHFREYYVALDGDSLDLDYYVLPKNLAKAKKHFTQVPEMLRIYEELLGKYPFWKDGYALVETPTLGMEHQGAISYGNKYLPGYLGGRLPKGMDWDYIIIHESGHEYWGNSVSCTDLAEMWLHESFTTYMEALYVEKRYGYERMVEYLLAQKKRIRNTTPIQGRWDINFSPMYSTDQYYKGSWMLHTLRNAIGNDSIWFGLLRGFYEEKALSNTTTEAFIEYVNAYTHHDYRPFFEQYLTYTQPPTLEYQLTQKRKKLVVKYRWKADVKGFDMPIIFGSSKESVRVHPTDAWQTYIFSKMKPRQFKVATSLFLVRTVRK